MQVFLSYRRSDVGGYAGRLVDYLRPRLGAKNVFHDVTAIGLGEDFTDRIDRALGTCDAVIAIIGPGWLGATTPEGDARLWRSDDFVRIELSRALERNVPVVPVLVGNASLPAAADLPEELRTLVQHQGVTLHDETWHEDVEGLLRRLRRDPIEPVPSKRRAFVAAAGALVLILATGAVWVSQRDGNGSGASTGATTQTLSPSDDAHPGCPMPGGDGWHRIELAAIRTGATAFEDGTSYTIEVADAQWRSIAEGKWQVILRTTMQHDDDENRQHGSWLYDILAVARMPFPVTCMSAVASDTPFVRPRLRGVALVGFEVTCKPGGHMALTLGGERGTIDVTKDTKPSAC